MIIVLFFNVANASTETINTKAKFDLGSYINTLYDTIINSLRLDTAASLTGEYLSQIFDYGYNTSFLSISWKPDFPYGKNLPDNAASESVYSSGNIDMSANVFLAHFDSPSDMSDSSGNGNDMLCSSLGCANSATGILGDSKEFNGKTIYAPNSTSLNPNADPMTICHWFKINGIPSNSSGIFYNKENLYEAAYYVSGGNLYYRYAWMPYWAWTGGNSFPITPNEWTFACIVYDKTAQKLYKNGQLVYQRSQTGNIGSNANPLCLGGRGSSCTGQLAYITDIDEFSIWRRALSDTEIMDIYKRGAAKLKLQVRSCNDAACSGETFSSDIQDKLQADNTLPSVTLSVPDNRYFQFKVLFSSQDANVKPSLSEVSFDYNINMAPPTDITLSSYSFDENLATSTTVATISAVDPNPTDTHTFSLVSGAGDDDNNLFFISGNELKLNFRPNYENPSDSDGNNIYKIRVKTTDSTNLSFEKAITLSVNDKNDAPKINNPSNVSVQENSQLAFAIDATDEDSGQTLRYLILGGPDADKFGINTLNGKVYFVSPPDFENPADADHNNVYELTVSAVDNGSPSASASKNMQITVLNIINENNNTSSNSSSSGVVQVINYNPLDSDGDGIPDSEEIKIGTNPFKFDSCSYFKVPLKIGSYGREVKKVQKFLKDQGLFKGEITGYFGPITKEAVKKFQEKYKEEILKPWGLDEGTGWWYKTTMEKANKLLGCKPDNFHESKGSDVEISFGQCPVFKSPLAYGDRGKEVLKLQKFLRKFGFLEVDPTGYFGPLTLRAVKRFQWKYKDEILKPWNLDRPSGWWYLSSIKKANEILGCR